MIDGAGGNGLKHPVGGAKARAMQDVRTAVCVLGFCVCVCAVCPLTSPPCLLSTLTTHRCGRFGQCSVANINIVADSWYLQTLLWFLYEGYIHIYTCYQCISSYECEHTGLV